MDIELMRTIIQLDRLSNSLDSVYKNYYIIDDIIEYSLTLDGVQYNLTLNPDIKSNHIVCYLTMVIDFDEIQEDDFDYFKEIVNELYNICLEKDLIK